MAQDILGLAGALDLSSCTPALLRGGHAAMYDYFEAFARHVLAFLNLSREDIVYEDHED
jgi:hypothetical protein